MEKKVYTKPYEMPVLAKIERPDNIVIKLYSGKNENKWYDIRRHVKNDKGELVPTKTGIRFGEDVLNQLMSMHEEFDDPVTKMILNEVSEEAKKVKKEKVKEMFKKVDEKKDEKLLSKKRAKDDEDSSQTPSDIEYEVKKTKK